MNLKKITIIILNCLIAIAVNAQQQTYKQLERNAVIQQHLFNHPNNAWPKQIKERGAATDTLALPFFDDFTTSKIYPNQKRWTNNYVFINNDAAINPPTYGVATFDNLNNQGQPYTGISLAYGSSDTLESQGIDLKKYQFPKNDSLYLSFYMQPQGLDIDPLYNPRDPQDSLVLEFYDKNGIWERVWEIGGKGLPVNFNHYFIHLDDPVFLHGGFRFRFINYSLQTGNSNHWHLDYVLLDYHQFVNDSNQEDVAFVAPPNNLLNDYYSMPWDQVYDNFLNEIVDSSRCTIKSFNKVPLYFNRAENYRDKNYKSLYLKTDLEPGFAQNLKKNIANGWKDIKTFYPKNTDTVIINRLWTHNLTGDKHAENDTVNTQTVFANYLAYDDGTAECGYGIENGGGKVALEFNLNQPDTLWAVSFFYNQSSTSVKGKPFKINIWKSVTQGTQYDTLYKTIDMPNGPEYQLGQNTFTNYILDTPVFLPAGKFFIGWSQTSDFVLNVGFDRNYKTDQGNQHLYYNVMNKWHKTNKTDLGGTPMIRAYLGSEVPFPTNPYLGIKQTVKFENMLELNIFPNPVVEYIQVGNTQNYSNLYYTVLDGQSKLITYQKLEGNTINVSNYTPGIYYIRFSDSKGNVCIKKVVKN